MRRRVRAVGFRLAALGTSLLVVLLILEAAVRIFVPSQYWLFRAQSDDWVSHPTVGWVQRPNDDVAAANGQGEQIRFRTNVDGLTPYNATRSKPADTIRIMFFGDSTVVGRTVQQDRTVNAQLEQLLRMKGVSCDAVNAGVEVYSTDQELLRMEELVPLYRPDVVLLAVCVNDFPANAMRTAFGRLSKPMFEVTEAGSLRLIPCNQNQQIKLPVGGLRDWVQRSALYRVLQPRLVVLRAKFGSWDERLLAGMAGDVYFRPGAPDAIDWRLFGKLVERMQACCRANSARLVLYAHPDVESVWDLRIQQVVAKESLQPDQYDRHAMETRLAHVAAELDIPFCPLVDYFAERQDQGPFHLLPRDPHCNAAGYRLTAEALTRFLLDRGMLVPSREDRSR